VFEDLRKRHKGVCRPCRCLFTWAGCPRPGGDRSLIRLRGREPVGRGYDRLPSVVLRRLVSQSRRHRHTSFAATRLASCSYDPTADPGRSQGGTRGRRGRLRGLSLYRYAKLFRANDIGLDVIPDPTAAT
jgi:hypothetical protein